MASQAASLTGSFVSRRVLYGCEMKRGQDHPRNSRTGPSVTSQSRSAKNSIPKTSTSTYGTHSHRDLSSADGLSAFRMQKPARSHHNSRERRDRLQAFTASAVDAFQFCNCVFHKARCSLPELGRALKRAELWITRSKTRRAGLVKLSITSRWLRTPALASRAYYCANFARMHLPAAATPGRR